MSFTLPPPLRGFRAALTFLTRVPVGGWPYRSEDFAWSSAHFPIVGALIGAFTGGVFLLMQPLGAPAAAMIALGATLLLTGCFHEDGLADTADALGGGFTREKVLEILKDSRVGSYGAAAIAVSLGLRAALMTELPSSTAWWMLALAGALSRTAPVWQMVAQPYITQDGTKSRDVARAGLLQALVASAWSAALIAVCCLQFGLEFKTVLIVLCSIFVATIFLSWRFQVRLGGITGDFLGTTQQVCEAAVLAVFVWCGP